MIKKRKWVTQEIAQGEQAADKQRAKIPKVLVVEDNSFNILPIQMTLKKYNFEFDIAKNGIMAIERFNNISAEGYIICLKT